ncbi:Glycosyl transferases group 1 [Aquimarina amphilecti]|uniref:Glycosyl transferases group 1 n=1 Tax=Aquimarina amphilecti TaxID=1038014 RepID=A0A1H7PQP5_AQUAM|nr:glycosyltransferase [Aquimarina amphilecti]SEL38103.1 Glycosyl transferases group 1 [Aquimarina amphilecti]
MKVLIVDNSGIIPAINYGGIERVIWGLGKELHKLGHEVVYLVRIGSQCDFAKVLELNPEQDLNSQIPDDIDIAHFSHTPLYDVDKPVIVTMHTNPPKEEVLNINTVFISKNHAKRYGSSTYVYNGLDWDDYPDPILNKERDYLHFLGKAAWKVKNVFGAAKITLESGNSLHILGGEKWNFRNLKRGLKYILNPKIIFRGMVNNSAKMEIIQYSKGLVFPVKWHEPFGLAITESLYAGCAVFGTENGSLPELITSEVGFTSNNASEISKAIKEFNYDPKRCHEYAAKYFNAKIMTASYVQLYEKILKGENLNNEVPKFIDKENIIPKFN